MRFVIEDHNAGCNEGPKLVGILTQEFVGLSRIGIAIPLWRVWLLENVIGVGYTPRVPKIAGWGARVAWRAWLARWVVQPASRWAWGPGREVKGPDWRAHRWAA